MYEKCLCLFINNHSFTPHSPKGEVQNYQNLVILSLEPVPNLFSGELEGTIKQNDMFHYKDY